jgi:YidC/Oxa1 family membrane protein insertase
VSILNPLADLVAWVIMHLHAGLGALFGPDTGLAWGLSIAILVILIRLCLVPLAIKQVHAQRKMAQHAPHLQELRKKYKNDKQRLNEETMKFYKENGVNPLAGCLPMIPQMVIFFSLFYVLRAIAEWKPGQVPKYGMTVSLMVSARRATIFGVHLSDKLLLPHTPGMGVTASIVAAVTVAVSASTTFLTVRQTSKRGLMQTNIDPDNPMAQSQKYMMYIVPFFSLTGLYWQYGLVLYWVTTNLWTLGQQYFMFRNWTVESTQPAGATANAGSPVRATQSSLRPSSGSAKTAAGAAKPAGTRPAGTRPATAKPAGTTTKAASATKPAAGSTRPTAANGRPASGNGRPATAGTRPKASASATSGSTGTQARPDAPRTGSARGDAAAASATPNDGIKRGRLRLGRQKPEPEPEPEVPAAKVVRQQPVRQAKSKRSGKR